MALPTLPEDRQCRPGALDNPLRRWLAPPRREIRRLGVTPGMTVADLGAGVGYFLPELAAEVGPDGQVYAVDPDGENLAIARGRPGLSPSIRFLEGTAAHVPSIPDGSVDRVLLSLVLCCLVDKEGTMEETWRILRAGGQVLITYPRTLNFGSSARRSLRVAPRRWAALLQRRPWSVLPVRGSAVVHRHLLEKPAIPPGPGQA